MMADVLLLVLEMAAALMLVASMWRCLRERDIDVLRPLRIFVRLPLSRMVFIAGFTGGLIYQGVTKFGNGYTGLTSQLSMS